MPDLWWATVVELGDDPGTVVVTDGPGTFTLPCMSSYPIRKVGDRVKVVTGPGGASVVEGNIRATPLPDVATVDDLEDAIRDLRTELLAQMTTVKLSNGTAAPSGSGWVAGTHFVRTTAGGDVEIYTQTAAVEPPPTNKPDPAAKPPKPVTVSADSARTWRPDGQTETRYVKAGRWTGTDWSGAWFFGTQIADACAGKNVAAMTISIGRRDSGGNNAKVPLHMFCHDRQTPGNVSTSQRRFAGPRLAIGGRDKSFDLPASVVAALASGDMRGIGIYGSGRDDYVICSASLSIRITFTT